MAAAGLLAPFAVGAVESLGLDSIGSLGGQVLSGVIGAGAVGLGYKAGKFVYSDLKRGYQNIVHRHGPDPYMGSKRQRTDDMNNGMDDYPVVGGDTTNVNRVTQKRKFKRGRIGRKLNREHEEFVQRWQRMYNYGTSTTAYTGPTEGDVPGCTNALQWPTLPVALTLGNYGRLPLSHVTNVGGTGFQYLPAYLFDITTWFNTSNTYDPVPFKRLGLNTTSLGNFQWVPIAQNFNAANSAVDRMGWGPESGPSGTGAPTSTEQKALLSWTDVRLCLYGARNFCTKVTIQFVQFKDPSFTFDFHPDGESIANMSQADRNKVNSFWMNEIKKYTFNPIDVQNFVRSQAVNVLHSESFCVNSENQNDKDSMPVAVVKQYFKRFNRLVNWNWDRPNLTVDLRTATGGLDNPDFLQTDQGNLKGYAHPKARIYMYIRAEDFIPIDAAQNLDLAPDREVTFDIIMRNKWRIQT